MPPVPIPITNEMFMWKRSDWVAQGCIYQQLKAEKWSTSLEESEINWIVVLVDYALFIERDIESILLLSSENDNPEWQSGEMEKASHEMRPHLEQAAHLSPTE